MKTTTQKRTNGNGNIRAAVQSAASIAAQIAALDGVLTDDVAAHHLAQAEDVYELLGLHHLPDSASIRAALAHALERGAARVVS